ncbi:hypothetical protein GALMADRAFT_154657 [Galerina marginata CBS 339.88]|uniref:Extracellular mutant protein 11 C-terminal domain-containing protein n=1 Tax=Galerina marginata (strain CBS 339.88) TaxID=685588 RepID=A0A067T8L1_GALM3|nr:hypothetical protein GALMADRAFT_154657 [Galerina marginata CBS 339.88]
MSARQPFFPQAPVRSDSRTNFVADQGNPLHSSSGAVEVEAKKLDGSLVSGSVASLNGNGMISNSRPTSGLGGLVKKRSNAAGSAAINRPGTADPHSSRAHQGRLANVQNFQVPVVAPTPQQAMRSSSSLLSRNTGSGALPLNNPFKVPSISDSSSNSDKSSEKNAHISTSDTTSSLLDASNNRESSLPKSDSDLVTEAFMQPPSLKFKHAGNSIGPRRIFIDPGPVQNDTFGNDKSISAHEVTEDGRIKAMPQRKRTRNEVDDDDEAYRHENPSKRHKGHPDNGTHESRRAFSRELLPGVERPSSGLSHTADRHSHGYQTQESPVARQKSRGQSQRGPSNSPLGANYSPYDMRHAQPRQEEAGALDKLLGQDTNGYVRENMDDYDRLVEKWTNCTMKEWLAGADEVASQYHKILDFVKEYVSVKLKLYGSFDTTIGKHNALLGDRNHVLDVARKRLVEESGSVLGK